MQALPRLLFLVPALQDPPETGGELYCLKLAQGLPRDWNVTVATFDDLPGFALTAVAYEGSLMRYVNDYGPFDVILQDTSVYRFSAEANRKLAQKSELIGFGQAVYSERYKRPWARWQHNRDMAAAMKGYRGLIVVNDATGRYAEQLRFPASCLAVVPPGYDLQEGKAPPPLTQPYRFVTAGSYQPSKGQLLAVEGMIELLRQRPYLRGKVRLDLYGNFKLAPAYVQEVKRAVAVAGLEDTIGVHGLVTQDNLWFEFARSHSFVNMASGEGMGRAAVEAMAFGCVPILSEDELSQDQIGADEVGILVPREKVGIATAMTQLLDNPPRWEELRKKAQARSELLVRKWDDVVADFSQELRRLSKLDEKVGLALVDPADPVEASTEEAETVVSDGDDELLPKPEDQPSEA